MVKRVSQLLALCCVLVSALNFVKAHENSSRKVTIALLHFAPKLAHTLTDIDENTALVAQGMRLAKQHGAEWVMTPELSLTGYRFRYTLGEQWFQSGLDKWTRQLQQTANEQDVVLFLSHVEQEPRTKKRYNSLFVFDQQGALLGKHRKINTIAGSEAWSSKGSSPTVVKVSGIDVGLLICADAWPKTHSAVLKQQGADLILSSANWGPGEYGPADTWEKRVSETGLPIVVNNRTGKEGALDMKQALSVVSVSSEKAVNGHYAKRLLSHHSLDNMVVIFTLDINKNTLSNLVTIPQSIN